MIDQASSASVETPASQVNLRARETAYSPEQAKVYDERRFVTADGLAIHNIELAQLKRALGYLPRGGRVLELGCGTGRFLFEVRRAGFQVDAADASGAMLEQVRQKFGDNLEGTKLMLAQAAEVPMPDQSYDLVYAIRLLNQTESPAYALNVISEMIRLAKPGGYILAEFANHYRPRIAAARIPTTRLKPHEVFARAKQLGASVEYCSGSFFLSMQAYHRSPKPILGPLKVLDQATSWLLPRLSARCYVLMRRGSSNQAASA